MHLVYYFCLNRLRQFEDLCDSLVSLSTELIEEEVSFFIHKINGLILKLAIVFKENCFDELLETLPRSIKPNISVKEKL